jgi:hypothetical protein
MGVTGFGKQRVVFAPRKRMRRRMSVLKNSGSFGCVKKTFGCAASQRANDVVPHLGAPMMKKLGFFMWGEERGQLLDCG